MDVGLRPRLAGQKSVPVRFDRSILVLCDSARKVLQSKDNEMRNERAEIEIYKPPVVRLWFYGRRRLEALDKMIFK